MRYFLDTEFIERPYTIDLISIGIKCEDEREFYAENAEADMSMANDFVKKNVIPQLKYSNRSVFYNFDRKSGNIEIFGDKKFIADAIKNFINPHKPEFWGYYADYDWVAFCWLFGSMVDLPKGWPMYCLDLKQFADSIGNPKFNKRESSEHNALADAKWNKEFYQFLLDKNGGSYGVRQGEKR